MKSICLIRKNIDVTLFMKEIKEHAELWNIYTKRQNTLLEHRDTFTIPLRSSTPVPVGADERHTHTAINTWMVFVFPRLHAFTALFAKEVDGEIGRVRLVNLKPGGKVKVHIDTGDYYAIRDRYHLVIQSEGKSGLRVNNEMSLMNTGELWWFDNKKAHSAFNTGTQPRIHLIFDVKPKEMNKILPMRIRLADRYCKVLDFFGVFLFKNLPSNKIPAAQKFLGELSNISQFTSTVPLSHKSHSGE